MASHDDDFDDEIVDDVFESDDEEGGSDDLDTEADVVCPWCGESVNITLDAGGGGEQEYVEDCEVCCRPWRVRVHYDDEGHADVSLDQG